MTVKDVEKSKKKPAVVAPEGGWGYAVAAALTIVFITGFSHMHSMGLLYGDFFMKIGYGVQGFTIVMAILNISFSISGMVTSAALKKYSLRAVGYAGCTILVLGWILTIFVTTLWQIVITVGIFQGLGGGIIMTVSLTSFNQYFNKRRMAVIGICKMFIGLANMVFPLIINFTLVHYGFTGTIMILTGIVMNAFVGIMFMQPVEWHQKKVVEDVIIVKEDETHIEETSRFIVEPVEKNGNELLGMSHHMESDNEEDIETKIKENQGRARAMSIVSNGQGVPIPEKLNKKTSLWKSLNEMLDMDLFKDPIFCNICFGVSLSLVSDMVFFSLIPLQMAADNYPKDQIAYALSTISGADLVARGIIGLLGNYVHFTSRFLCTVGIVGTFIFRILYLQIEGFTLIIILVGILGFLRSPVTVGGTIIYAEYIPEKFTAAFGLQTLVTGVLGSLLTPGVGWLKDYTQSYFVTFHILNLLYLLIIIPWCIEFYLTRNKNKETK